MTVSGWREAVRACGLAVLVGCTRVDSVADRTAEAARADSSAAGYAVGGSGASTSRLPTMAATAVASASTDPHAVTTATSAPSTRDSAPRAHTKSPTPVDSGYPATDSVKPKQPPLPVGLTRVNEFLSYDAQIRTATLQIIAGYNGLNDGLNYNGGARGSQGLVVPLGWTVRVTVTNRDSDLQHSAIVIRQVLPPPEELPAAAFPGAQLPQLEEGVHEGDTTSFAFVADRAGQFMLACAIPGHAQGGMWLRLAVTSDVDRPLYR